MFGQVFNADGTPRGGEFQVNTYTSQEQHNCSVAAPSDGGWVVTWESFYQDGASYEIYAQAFNADGTPRGEEFVVNTTYTYDQENPSVTALADGGWVVTWDSDTMQSGTKVVFGQAYNADGSARGR